MSINSLYASPNVNSAMLDYIDAQNNHKANSMVDHLNNADNASSSLNGTQKQSPSQLRKTTSSYGGGINSEIGQAALNRALAELSSETPGKITLSMVYEYRQNLEKEFSLALRLAMAEKGVDTEEEFVLTMDRGGNITVEADNPNTKYLVQQFLKDNPKVCDQFGYIQALSNLEQAQKSHVWQGISNIKAEITANALEHMFSDTLNTGLLDYSALTAKASSGGEKLSFYSGFNFTV